MNNVALVTGASSGIGLEVARLHASAGSDLILVARSTSKLNALRGELEEAYHVEVLVLPKDLSIPDAALELYEAVAAEGIEVEYLFNIAGFGDFGVFQDKDWDRIEMMMNVNMLTPTHLTYLFGADMLARGRGGILNVSGHTYEPKHAMAVYNASKQYIQTLHDSLADEWAKSGVTLALLRPDATDTNFHDKAGAPPKAKEMLSPAEVAAEGYSAVVAHQVDTPPHPVDKVLESAKRWLPKGLRKSRVRD